MFILLYLCEGVVRATTDNGPSQWLAAGETLLSALFFWSAIVFVRLTRSAAK